jgi:hypothetical protein
MGNKVQPALHELETNVDKLDKHVHYNQTELKQTITDVEQSILKKLEAIAENKKEDASTHSKQELDELKLKYDNALSDIEKLKSMQPITQKDLELLILRPKEQRIQCAQCFDVFDTSIYSWDVGGIQYVCTSCVAIIRKTLKLKDLEAFCLSVRKSLETFVSASKEASLSAAIDVAKKSRLVSADMALKMHEARKFCNEKIHIATTVDESIYSDLETVLYVSRYVRSANTPSFLLPPAPQQQLSSNQVAKNSTISPSSTSSPNSLSPVAYIGNRSPNGDSRIPRFKQNISPKKKRLSAPSSLDAPPAKVNSPTAPSPSVTSPVVNVSREELRQAIMKVCNRRISHLLLGAQLHKQFGNLFHLILTAKALHSDIFTTRVERLH